MPDKFSPIEIFLSAFTISSLAGLASYLRSRNALTTRSVVSAVLNSGMLGLAIAFLWYNYFNEQDQIWFLLGISLLAGLGGVSLLEFILMVLRRGGIELKINTDPRMGSEEKSKEDND